MNVIELKELADWFESYRPPLKKLFNQLQSILSNNANQTAQSPIGETLNELTHFMSQMDTSVLSVQQLAILQDLGLNKHVGKFGAQYISNLVVTSTYDPATTRDTFDEEIRLLSSGAEKLRAYANAVTELGIEESMYLPEEGRYIIRVGFRNDASINNIVDWKVSAADWHLIIRGVAIAAGETPEETSVIGATRGSLIMILAASATVTKLMAMISKHLTGIAKDFISVGMEIENLKQKKLLTASIKQELESQRDKLKDEGLEQLKKELLQNIGSEQGGEEATALNMAINKLLDFEEKGGDLDFVTPPETDTSDENEDTGPDNFSTELESVRQAILEYNEEREAIKMLTHSDES